MSATQSKEPATTQKSTSSGPQSHGRRKKTEASMKEVSKADAKAGGKEEVSTSNTEESATSSKMHLTKTETSKQTLEASRCIIEIDYQCSGKKGTGGQVATCGWAKPIPLLLE
jgi:hypothetical protein